VQEEATQGLGLTQKEQLLIGKLYQSLQQASLYSLLGIPSDANSNQIRDAYYNLSRVWHPDRFFRRDVGDHGPQIEAIFTAFTRAYQTLSDDSKRAVYDQELQAERAGDSTQHAPQADVRPATKAAKPEEGSDPSISVESGDSKPRAKRAVRDDDEEGSTILDTQAASSRRAAKKVKARDAVRKLRASRQAMKARYRKRVIAQMRKEIRGTTQRAQTHYRNGKQELEEGRPLKAESALYLAVKLNPKNETYRADFEEAKRQSRQIRSEGFISAAGSAEQYGKLQEALYNYRKAVECDCQDARVFHRIGLLIKRIERDDREALASFRAAVLKAPDNPEYRLTLADMYAQQGLSLNARREYQAVIRVIKNDRKNSDKNKEHLARAREMLRKMMTGLLS
jgi:curved DNA-binding protein CbpA